MKRINIFPALRPRTVFRVFGVAMLLLMGACGNDKHKEEAGEVPEIQVAYPEVDSVVLHKSYPAVLATTDMAEVVGRVNGMVTATHFKGGQYVREGAPLLTIESSKYRDIVEQAEAALKTARTQYDYYSRQCEAMRKALESDAVSKMDVAQAESNLAQAEASIQNARAALQTVRTNLGYCVVRAPISGYITSPTVDVGSYVGGEGAPVKLATIYDEVNLQARFHIEESQYEEMVGRNGGIRNPLLRKVPITFRNPLPHDYYIDISYEAPSVDPSTGTLLIKGKLTNIDGELKDGMYCTVSLPYGTRKDAILVKDASIGTDQLGKYVYVVNDSNKVVYTHIEVGELYRDSLRIVDKGLGPRDRYVTKALLKVRDGERVRPVMAPVK